MATYNPVWQTVVSTEFNAYRQNTQNDSYLGFPWANLIERKCSINDAEKFLRPKIEATRKENYSTVSQHIRFRVLIPVLKKFSITTIYTPHKIKGENLIDGVVILPCAMHAVSLDGIEPLRMSKGSRKYLFSFQGAWQTNYLTSIRKDLFSLGPSSKYLINDTGDWFYNKLVFGAGNKDEKYRNEMKRKYNELLADSTFSLCPSGAGPGTIRFWESLGLGSIPVVLADTLDLPDVFLTKPSIVIIPEADFGSVNEILSNMSLEETTERRNNCVALHNLFRNDYALLGE